MLDFFGHDYHNKVMRFLNLLIILLTITVMPTAIPIMAEERVAPDFTLTDINGRTVSFSDFRGKVILLNFWATWCTACIDEMDSLNKAYLDMRDKGFVVIGISIDQSRAVVSDFVKRKGLKFPVLLDPEKEVYFDRYAVFGLPTSFLIDRRGYIRQRYIGEMDWQEKDFVDKVHNLLNEKGR
jgi:peroxiredoxin